ncbi:phage recombination protein Bet [Enterococcus olivae]
MASENELMTKPVTFDVNGEEVKLSGNMIKQYLVSGGGNVSDQEVVLFLNLCRFQHLNPFLKEAFLVKFQGEKPAEIIVSKEAFMKRAESHPEYDGFEAGIVVQRKDELVEIEGSVKLKDDILIGGWAKVHRKDRERRIKVVVDFGEFSKGRATWKTMPQNMIRKVAIVNALREAFPDYLGAMYTEDDSNPVPSNVQEEPVKSEKINQLESIANSTQGRTIKQAEPFENADPFVEPFENDAVAEYNKTKEEAVQETLNFDREERSDDSRGDSPF